MDRIFPIVFRLVLAVFLLGGATSFAQQIQLRAEARPITQLRVESVEFQDADLPTVLDFLGTKASEGNGTPHNFFLFDPLGKIIELNPLTTLSLRNIPLSQVLNYVSKTTGTELQVDQHAGIFLRKKDRPLLMKLRKSRLTPNSGTKQINQLNSIIIPQIDLQDTTLREAIGFLRLKAWESCPAENPSNFIIRSSAIVDPGENVFSIKLHQVTLLIALQYITELGQCSMRFDPRAIIIGAPNNISPITPDTRQRNPQFNLILNAQIEEVSMEEASLAEAIQLIAYFSRNPQIAPDGPNFITMAKTDRKVTLNLRKVRAIDVLRYINEQTGTNFRVEKNAISIIELPPPKLKPGKK